MGYNRYHELVLIKLRSSNGEESQMLKRALKIYKNYHWSDKKAFSDIFGIFLEAFNIGLIPLIDY